MTASACVNPPSPRVYQIGDRHESKGEISLHGAALELGDPLPGTKQILTAKEFEFTVSTLDGKKFPLRAKSDQERTTWKDLIESVITTPAVTQTILCAGWLKKSSVKGNRNTDFKERFCVLLRNEAADPERRCTIFYYDKPWQVTQS